MIPYYPTDHDAELCGHRWPRTRTDPTGQPLPVRRHHHQGEHVTTTPPPATPEPPDLAAIHARAQRHARLERDAGRDITLAEISAAISSADDVPALLAEVRRLRRSPRLIREAAILRQSADRAEAAGSPDAIVATLRRRADELDPPPPTTEEATDEH